MGELQSSHMFRTFTLRTKRRNKWIDRSMYLFVCVCVDVVYEDEVGPRGRWVASSERMIVIALAGRQTGKHIFDCLFDPRVCRGKQQTC